MKAKRGTALILLLALLLSLVGCKAPLPEKKAPETTPAQQWTPTPAPAVMADPAPVLAGVETDRKVVSLIFEGYTDSTTMDALAEVLKERDVPATFFISGITANENPEVVRKLAVSGFAIGSYGMSGAKHLEKVSAYENMQRFQMAQRELKAAIGREPELVRCNGTLYTEDVLRAVTAAGLRAAVEPTAYLNHKSFRTEEDARTYALGVLRGSILTVKLGQELDEDEYGDPGDKLDERPAIDPPPGIRWEWSTEEERFALLPEMVGWLVDALKADGYRFTDPESLQEEGSVILRKDRELDAEEQSLLDPDKYSLPVTEAPLSAGESREAARGDFRGAVFVGDAAMESLAGYVEWQRREEPDFLDDAQFLTGRQLTVESLLSGESEVGDLAAELSRMKARSVWLCLGFSNARAYRQGAYLSQYRLLIREIQEKNPRIRIVIMSVLPKAEGHAGVSNRSRFELNMGLCAMCREYSLDYADVAWAVRDEKGQLREDYCLDLASRGSHLNDAGCKAVLDYIGENYPS